MLSIPETLPASVAALLEGASYTPDELGLSQSEVRLYDNGLVLKISPLSPAANREAVMLNWLQGRLPVPEVKAFETENNLCYLLMTRLSGEEACSKRNLADPRVTATRMAEGLKLLWSVDVSDIPDTAATLDKRLAEARERMDAGLCRVEDADPEVFGNFGFIDFDHLYRWMLQNRPEPEPEELVLTHGDYYLSNVFFDKSGVTGLIDLPACGVGEKWADIALCMRSIGYALEEITGHPEDYPLAATALFQELGLAPDRNKLTYYLLLDEFF